MNKRNPSGFTIIEVSLFLAISAAMMLAILGGLSVSISRQHYTDTVNDVLAYIRTVYTDVQSVTNGSTAEGINGGKGFSSTAAYGRVLQFNGSKITSIPITAKAINKSFISIPDGCNATTLDFFKCLNPTTGNLYMQASLETDQTSTYTLVWDGKLETTASGDTPFSGSLIVVRSPITDAIETYYSANTSTDILTLLSGATNTSDINICIDSDDNLGKRQNLRIKAGASNSSGILLTQRNTSDNQCAD